MVQADASKILSGPVIVVRSSSLRRIMLLLIPAFVVLLALYRMSPPPTVGIEAPPAEFSSGRAMQYLREISRDSHAIGSTEHQRVCDYISNQLTAMGLSPEIQQTAIVEEVGRGFIRGASVRNIIARLRGTNTGDHRAVMLVGHYDSKQLSLGASDDGSAVAAMLETLRALQASAPLKNDVIFLFTDGEEIGLAGARAFVSKHAWAKTIGVVLNFEARGTNGPVMMFETSKENKPLIDALAATVRHPVANSLMSDIYRLLPNDTDLTVFKESGFAGMNFAFIGGVVRYHTPLDNLQNIDERSLQHHGSYALALARYFGSQDLDNYTGPDAVYFDLLGAILVHYSVKWVIPLTVFTVLLFLAVVELGRRKQLVTLAGIARGFGIFILSLLASVAAVFLAWRLLRAVSDTEQMMRGNPYHAEFFYAGLAALAVGVVACFCAFFSKRVHLNNLALGALFCELILLVASSIFLRGASYLLMWPLVGSLIALGAIFATTRQNNYAAKDIALLVCGAVPALMLLVPVIYMLFVGLDLNLAILPAATVVILLGFLIPYLSQLTATRWVLPATMATASVCLLGLGLALARFNDNQPRPNNIFYGMNADKHEAIWASSDARPDKWTAQFLTDTPQRGPLEDYFPGAPRPFLKSQAPLALVTAPEIKVLDDRKEQERRTLRLRITSTRGAPLISIYGEPAARIKEVSVNGERKVLDSAAPTNDGPWVMRYYAPPADLEVVMETTPGAEVKLKVVDQSYALPALPNFSLQARPANLMPSSAPWSDATMVSRSFSF